MNDINNIKALYENLNSVDEFDNSMNYNQLIDANKLKAAIVSMLSKPHKNGLLEQVMQLREIRDPHIAIAEMLDDVIDTWAEEDYTE